MDDRQDQSLQECVVVSLVGGEADLRHHRQLMLRAERYEVRAYSTCAAVLADPRSRDCACIIIDVGTDAAAFVLDELSATGWRGKAVLLAEALPGQPRCTVERKGDRVLGRQVGDRALIAAIEGVVDRSWRAGTDSISNSTRS